MQKDSQDFVTEKMLTEYANDVLRLTNFPRTDRNISLITKELLDDASSSNIQAAHDNLIKNMYKGQTRQKKIRSWMAFTRILELISARIRCLRQIARLRRHSLKVPGRP